MHSAILTISLFFIPYHLFFPISFIKTFFFIWFSWRLKYSTKIYVWNRFLICSRWNFSWTIRNLWNHVKKVAVEWKVSSSYVALILFLRVSCVVVFLGEIEVQRSYSLRSLDHQKKLEKQTLPLKYVANQVSNCYHYLASDRYLKRTKN